MPANLTPQYQKAENEYRRAQSAEERVECLERMLQLIPKHKGTEKLQADLKSKLKETRAEVVTEKKAGKKGRSYKVPHQGAGQVIILGAPNSGKSRLMAELTNASPEVADYPFTTREPMPAMMPWQDVLVQLIDTPPITDTHLEPYLTSMIRSADRAVLCLNGSSDDGPDEAAAVIDQLASRKTLLSDRTGFDDKDFAVVHIETILAVTHGRDTGCDERLEYFTEVVPRAFKLLRMDLDYAEDVELLRNRIYESLDVIRVYTKRPGKPADHTSPFTIPRNGTVEDLALCVHRELAESLKFARVWGTSAHDGQTVGREHALADEDIVELHS